MAKQLCSLCYYISSCNKTAKIRLHINIMDPLKPLMHIIDCCRCKTIYFNFFKWTHRIASQSLLLGKGKIKDA